MSTFGKYLFQERELRALSREDVAQGTRLSVEAIAALEEDRFDALPGEAFTLGYIRSYASCIGLDPDDAVLRYQEARQANGAVAGASGPSEHPPRWIVPALALVGVAALGLATFLLYTRS